jgi:hypothetical protein
MKNNEESTRKRIKIKIKTKIKKNKNQKKKEDIKKKKILVWLLKKQLVLKNSKILL